MLHSEVDPLIILMLKDACVLYDRIYGLLNFLIVSIAFYPRKVLVDSLL